MKPCPSSSSSRTLVVTFPTLLANFNCGCCYTRRCCYTCFCAAHGKWVENKRRVIFYKTPYRPTNFEPCPNMKLTSPLLPPKHAFCCFSHRTELTLQACNIHLTALPLTCPEFPLPGQHQLTALLTTSCTNQLALTAPTALLPNIGK